MSLFLTVLVVTAQFPDTFLGSISVGNNPVDLCISPDGQRAYAAVAWGYATAIDLEGYSELSLAGLVTIDGEPSAVQCDETGEKLYVADTENSMVHVVNTGTLTVESSFQVEASPVDMVLCSGINRILLSHSAGMITVINTLSSTVEDVFWAGNSLHSMAVSPDGRYVYAPDSGSPYESLITAATGSVNRFSSGMDTRAAALSGSGEFLFLSCTEWGLISVMNTEELTVETTISCEAPVEMAALPALPYIYGVNPDMNVLSVYSTDDLQIMGTVPVPGEPVNIAVHPDGERIFVVCSGDNKMKVYGYDPEGIEPDGTTVSILPGCSPSAVPSVVIRGVSGRIIIRGFDISGRNLFENEITGEGSTEFFLPEMPSGILLVTAESGEERLCTQVVVLKP